MEIGEIKRSVGRNDRRTGGGSRSNRAIDRRKDRWIARGVNGACERRRIDERGEAAHPCVSIRPAYDESA